MCDTCGPAQAPDQPMAGYGDKASNQLYANAKQGPGLGRAVRVPLAEQLGKAFHVHNEKSERIKRAADILARHPEFEEFLQLQELISSGLFY